MSNINELIDLNTRTAELVAAQSRGLDIEAADLLLRNTFAAAYRITPGKFRTFRQASIDVILDSATAAKKLAPLDLEDRKQLTHETDAEFTYRTSVPHPLHNLQTLFHYSINNPPADDQVEKLKTAVGLAGTAFKFMIDETRNFPAIIEAESYFWGNTIAAARRMNTPRS